MSVCLMEHFPIFLAIKARTGFLHTGQLPMSHNQGLRKEAVEFPKQFQQGHPLFHGSGVGRFSVCIQSAFIADADAATVKLSLPCADRFSVRSCVYKKVVPYCLNF